MKKIILAAVLIAITSAIMWKTHKPEPPDTSGVCDIECKEYHRFMRRMIDDVVKHESGW